MLPPATGAAGVERQFLPDRTMDDVADPELGAAAMEEDVAGEGGEAGGQRAHQVVLGEAEVLQGPQRAKRGREAAGEGELAEVEPGDGGGFPGAQHVRPRAEGMAGPGLPDGEGAGGVREHSLGGEEVTGVVGGDDWEWV